MRHGFLSIALAMSAAAAVAAQTPAQQATSPKAAAAPTTPQGIQPPADYVVGANDALDVVFWSEKDMSASVVVRPDGKISLPLLNDVDAAGLTPEQLRSRVTQLAGKFVEDPTVTVVVKAINSRKVFITGMVGRPGPYPLVEPTTVLQLISTAGGLQEYAKKENIRVIRQENGRTTTYRFNYKQVAEGKSLAQNIALKPGDTIIVP